MRERERERERESEREREGERSIAPTDFGGVFVAVPTKLPNVLGNLAQKKQGKQRTLDKVRENPETLKLQSPQTRTAFLD